MDYQMLRYGCMGLNQLMSTPRSEGGAVMTSASSAVDTLISESKEADLANAFSALWNTQIGLQMHAALERFDAATGALAKLIEAYGLDDLAKVVSAANAAADSADDIPPLLTTIEDKYTKGQR